MSSVLLSILQAHRSLLEDQGRYAVGEATAPSYILLLQGRTPLLIRIAIVTIMAAAAGAEDWPQFLGPARNGVYSGNDLPAKWPPGGPAVVWKKDVGQGFSSPVLAQGRLILFHRVANKEVIEALDAAT